MDGFIAVPRDDRVAVGSVTVLSPSTGGPNARRSRGPGSPSRRCASLSESQKPPRPSVTLTDFVNCSGGQAPRHSACSARRLHRDCRGFARVVLTDGALVPRCRVGPDTRSTPTRVRRVPETTSPERGLGSNELVSSIGYGLSENRRARRESNPMARLASLVSRASNPCTRR